MVLTIIGIIMTVIQYLPQFLTAIKEIIALIKHLHAVNPGMARHFLDRLNSAVKAARMGDLKPIQDLAADAAHYTSAPEEE